MAVTVDVPKDLSALTWIARLVMKLNCQLTDLIS
jgi:hypothetical protein